MRGQNANIRFGGPITPVVKKLLVVNGSIFILQQFGGLFDIQFAELFGLSHNGFVNELRIWQIVTYMFLHGGWLHVFFNLLTLWMFAGELEQLWGSKFFLRYYLFSGIGAGVFISGMNAIMFQQYQASPITIDASGAIYGILLAYGMTWPNREVLLYFVFPIKMKYLVFIFGLIEFFGTLSSVGGKAGNISHIGHLGGIIAGYGFLFFKDQQYATTALPFGKKKFFSKLAAKRRNKRKQKTIDDRIIAKKIIEELLDKIARGGMSTLSHEEKKNLEWARKHYYHDRQDTLH